MSNEAFGLTISKDEQGCSFVNTTMDIDLKTLGIKPLNC